MATLGRRHGIATVGGLRAARGPRLDRRPRLPPDGAAVFARRARVLADWTGAACFRRESWSPRDGAPGPAGGGRMIRVVVCDHHPATCAGVNAILPRARGGRPQVGVAADRRALWPLLYRADPDVVVVDDLRLGLAVRARQPNARVVLHTADAGFGMIVPAAFAGAHALVDKRCSPCGAGGRDPRREPAADHHPAAAAARRGEARRDRSGDPGDAAGGHAGPRDRRDRRDRPARPRRPQRADRGRALRPCGRCARRRGQLHADERRAGAAP